MPMKVRGKDRVFAKLRALSPAMFEELTTANRQTADEMVDFARGFVPKKSGDLANSIVATPPGGTTPSYAQGGPGGIVPPGAYAVTAGNSKVRYAHLVEHGTKSHVLGGIFKGGQHPGTPAQPFFYPAYRLARKKHKGRAKKAVKRAIEKVAKT